MTIKENKVHYIISYDISSPKRLRKVAKKCEGFALRVQKSVFETELTKTELEELKDILVKILEPKFDSIRIYPLCKECESKIDILGKGEKYETPAIFFV